MTLVVFAVIWAVLLVTSVVIAFRLGRRRRIEEVVEQRKGLPQLNPGSYVIYTVPDFSRHIVMVVNEVHYENNRLTAQLQDVKSWNKERSSA